MPLIASDPLQMPTAQSVSIRLEGLPPLREAIAMVDTDDHWGAEQPVRCAAACA